ncbi:hypothetical protein OBBRIDRAFT_795575 [Obba rivulosa]|uniref:Uncharacterized protein n=1 Tax=Obba rivulosa TaxID=1052685 RepID=A0A8E2DJQ8_9APHY|nr:hypothetical protein OBBRIDRAFT_795575 [Obba rivulosa]
MAASVDTDLESADSPIASRTQRASGGLNKLFRLDLATSTKRKIREGQEIQERTLKTLEEGKSVIPGDQHQDLHSQFRDLEKRGETLESYSGFQAFRHRGVVSKWLKAVEKLYSKTLTKSKQARSDKLLEEQMDLLEHELEEMELGPPCELLVVFLTVFSPNMIKLNTQNFAFMSH